MTKSNKQQACTETEYQVSRAQLPLSCPLPEMRVWDAHPRVYLAIEEEGNIDCPYCGAHFVLTDAQA